MNSINYIIIRGIWLFSQCADNSDHSHEPLQGRRATNSHWFFVALHNSWADTSWFSSCEIQEQRGWVGMGLQPLPGLIPLPLSTLSWRAACACLLGFSRRTWPKSEWRLLAIISRTFGSSVWRWTIYVCDKIVSLNAEDAMRTSHMERLNLLTVFS